MNLPDTITDHRKNWKWTLMVQGTVWKCTGYNSILHQAVAFLTIVFLLGCSGEAAEPDRVVPRSAWSVVAPDEALLKKKPNGRIRYISIHQTETPFPDTVDDIRRLRGIQNWHQTNSAGPKWGDIAYHYLVASDGRIFQGRDPKYAASSGTVYLTQAQWEAAPLNKNGQTTASKPDVSKPGASEGHLTISVIGSFNDQLPSEVMRRNLAKFVALKLKEHQLSIDDVYFHREIACWTDCPGQELYDWFRGVSRERRAKGPGMHWIEKELAILIGGN